MTGSVQFSAAASSAAAAAMRNPFRIPTVLLPPPRPPLVRRAPALISSSSRSGIGIDAMAAPTRASSSLLCGKQVSRQILSELVRPVKRLREQGIVPCLAPVLVGHHHPESLLYLGRKRAAAQSLGMTMRLSQLPQEADTEQE